MGGSQDTSVPNPAWPGVIQGLGISGPSVFEPSVSACQPVSGSHPSGGNDWVRGADEGHGLYLPPPPCEPGSQMGYKRLLG